MERCQGHQVRKADLIKGGWGERCHLVLTHTETTDGLVNSVLGVRTSVIMQAGCHRHHTLPETSVSVYHTNTHLRYLAIVGTEGNTTALWGWQHICRDPGSSSYICKMSAGKIWYHGNFIGVIFYDYTMKSSFIYFISLMSYEDSGLLQSQKF